VINNKHFGIKRQFTTRYTPHQNGVEKRKNKKIMNIDRSLLKENHLSNDFLGESFTCYVYLLIRSPTNIVNNKVPQESWSGMKCSVSHFRVFVCVAYAHVHEKLRKKLDEKSEKYIFTRYSEHSKAYRL
jgi:hypothetical protein